MGACTPFSVERSPVLASGHYWSLSGCCYSEQAPASSRGDLLRQLLYSTCAMVRQDPEACCCRPEGLHHKHILQQTRALTNFFERLPHKGSITEHSV